MSQSSGALAWRTAWKIAWRDLRASWTKFAFVVVAVALGVGSLTGMRSFSAVFETTLLSQARTIMAADLSALTYHPYTDAQLAQLDRLQTQGVQHTLVTQTVSMASTSTSPNPLLVALKVIDPAQYPYYGAVQLASGRPLRNVLVSNAAVASEEFLLRMHVQIGDTLQLGNSTFRIVDVIQSEPDRISSSFGLGPRVMITQSALAATGLALPGSRAAERMIFRLPSQQAGNTAAITIDRLRKQVETILPGAQVTDYREANPALAEGLRRSTAMLTLISLVTMVLSAIGVGMAMHAHLQQRLETIAIMKALGARSSQVMRIYLLQTVFLGTAGALAGIVAGSAIARAFPVLLARLISLPVTGHLSLGPVVVGLLTGILTTLLFTLPPLLEIRNFRPLRILRRNVEGDSNISQERGERNLLKRSISRIWPRVFPRDPIQLAAIAIILIVLAAIASTLTQSAMVGAWFAAGLFAVLIFLLLAAAGMLAATRTLLHRRRARFSPAARQGLANLYRPGNQSAPVLTALGVGVMLIMTTYSMQHAIVRDLNNSDASKAPNVFLIDISPQELSGITKLIAVHPAVHGSIETIPIVSASVLSINGVAADQLHIAHYPKRMLRSTSVSWADTLPTGEKIVSGHWPQRNSGTLLAVVDDTAKRLHLGVGSHMVFQIGGQQIASTVVALYHSDGQHVYSHIQFILPRDVLSGQPVIWYGAFHADPARVGDVERTLFAAYPTVTVINVADVMVVIQKAVTQIATIIRFLAGFAMLAGGIILASSVTATRFQRVREVAILKSLGALRSQMIAMLSVEFLVLGGIAGIAGVLFSLVLSAILLHRLEVSFHPGWPICIAAVFATAILAAAIGWLASLRILQQKPLEVLREE
jgi:putative ABC transport system permease protein